MADLPALPEQFGVRPGARKDHQAGLHVVIEFVGQEEIAVDVAFPIPLPIPDQGMVAPFRPERESRSQSLRKLLV